MGWIREAAERVVEKLLQAGTTRHADELGPLPSHLRSWSERGSDEFVWNKRMGWWHPTHDEEFGNPGSGEPTYLRDYR